MARAKAAGPRRGSRCNTALYILFRARAMSRADWMLMLDFVASPLAFDRDIIQPLRGWKLIESTGGEFVVTDAGRRFLGVMSDAEALAAPAPARDVYQMRPLSAQHRPLRNVIRAGALDYREIPSRVGDQLIPHGEKAVA